MNCALTSPAGWTERYEALRRYVLEGRQLFESQPLGLALWLAQGMAGWMKRWTAPLPVTAPAPVGSAAAGTGPWQEQLTWLLAQMTLEHFRPANSL
jgi:hypothetical protein